MKVGGGATLPEAAAAFVAKGVDVAVVGLGTALAAGTDENLRPRCRPS
jgi:pyruvate/2-oxoglutarate dehydrogenase complex dihydrolipoamide dehydrogenase (E3) component